MSRSSHLFLLGLKFTFISVRPLFGFNKRIIKHGKLKKKIIVSLLTTLQGYEKQYYVHNKLKMNKCSDIQTKWTLILIIL